MLYFSPVLTARFSRVEEPRCPERQGRNAVELSMKNFLYFCGFLSVLSGLFLVEKSASAFDFGAVQFHGYIDTEYTKTDKNANARQNLKNGAFDAHHFNLVMEAPVNEKLLVSAMIGFEHGPQQSTAFDKGRILTEFAWGQYTVADYFKIRAGKMFTPFGLLNEIHDVTPALLTVRVPQTLYSAQERGGDPLFPEWSTGFAVLGNFSFLQEMTLDYILYLANGESTGTTNEAQFDDNVNKAVGGRILFSPWEFLTTGFSFFRGDKAINNLLDKTHASYGFSLSLDWDNFNLTGEIFDSKITNVEQQASYVQASYTFLDKITPHIKYEFLDFMVNEQRDWHDLGIGINFKVMDGLVLKAEYHNQLRGPDNSEFFNNIRRFNEFDGQVAIAF